MCGRGAWRGGGACVAGGHAWWGACMVGVCMAGGMYGRGDMHGGGGGVWQGACMAGVCVMGGGMHGWGTCMAGGMHSGRHGRGRGACVALEMTTAEGGTHPSGMHSCDILV